MVTNSAPAAQRYGLSPLDKVTTDRSTVFNGSSITRRPGPPRIRTVRTHLARTSSLPDSATCSLHNAQWPSSSSFREKPPSAFPVSLSSGSEPPTTLVAWPAWRFWSSRGGLALAPRGGGREGRSFQKPFPRPMKEASSSRVGGAGAGAEDVGSSSGEPPLVPFPIT